MNDDLLGIMIFFLFIACFISLPLLIVASIFACGAWVTTKKWKKEKARRGLDSGRTNADVEAETAAFVSNADDIDDRDSLDLDTDSESSEDDEADTTTTREERATAKAKAKALREEENKPDWHLTTGQKFRKEFKKLFTGRGQVDAVKKRERAERKKMAKAVAIEMARVERKRAKKANKVQPEGGEGSASGSGVAEDGLPSYNIATAVPVDDGKR